MRAVTCQDAVLELSDVPDPPLERGQVRLEVLRCGICGSDLHARHHCDELADVMGEVGYDGFMRPPEAVVLGHEFSGRVAEYGPGCRAKVPTGADVVAFPLLRGPGGAVHPTGLSRHAPGGYAERVVVQEALMHAVPNGLPPDRSALTEPLAVAWHAVRRGEVGRRDVAIVIGCGPIGLGVILMLKARGVRTVVASDLSPGRRALARACGADHVVDPGVESPYAFAAGGHLTSAPQALELVTATAARLDRIPVPQHQLWRVIEGLGLGRARPIVFECVGVPGMIDRIVAEAPWFSRVVVVGVCMGADRLRPSMAINKEIDLRFVLAYTPLEFRQTLHMLAEGEVDPAPLVTGVVGLDGVNAAFEALGDPEAHAKILIDPASPAEAPAPARAPAGRPDETS